MSTEVCHQQQLDGDGPPTMENYGHANCKESPWTNLPAPVFEKLCSKLEPAFLYVARQVCASWLHAVETLVGLKVKVDTSVSGNLEFVQSVKVTQARIVNWQLSDPSETLTANPLLILQFPTCLKKLTICGKLPVVWKLQHLQEFPSLQHFVLRGVAMHSNNITGSPFPAHDPALTSLERQEMYQNFEPPILHTPIRLKRLKKLEVVMNEFSYPSSLPLSVRLNEPDRAHDHELNLQRLYLLVLNNITFILNNIRCPQLSACQLYIYPKAGIVPPSKLNWKNLPLQRFLENHKHSLKQLFLPDFEGKHENSTLGDSLQIPTKLSKLQLLLTRFIGDREEAREQSSGYWNRFLTEQTQLKDLYLSFTDLSTVWLESALTSLLFSCRETLSYVDISVQSDETVQLNLEMFSFCHSLKVLKIAGRDNETLLRNINKLPASLVKLYLSMSLVEPPQDPNFMQKFINLEMLVVKTVLVADNQQHQQHAQTVVVIQNLFRLRKLNMVMLTFDAPLNTNRNLSDLRRMLSLIDEDIDSPYPVFTIKCNVAYEFEEGWNEETFDEDNLGIEFVNMREPEEYNTWPHRHRNAISVDDEDHRIFMFQTLPFLLGGARRGAIALMGDDDDVDNDPLVYDDDDDSDVDSDGSTIAIDSVDDDW